MWSSVAALEVTIDSVALEPRLLRMPGFTRHTTVIRLCGGGSSGCGEDVAWHREDHEALRAAAPGWPTGRFDLAGFSAALARVELFPRRPASHPDYVGYRRWAVESAALDLALRQAGRSLGELLGRRPAALRFVASTGLGDPPAFDNLERVLRRAPGARFKLDANAGWSQRFLDALAARRITDVIDLKGAYAGTDVDTPGDPALYRRVAETLPDALLEDPAWNAETAAVLDAHRERIAWDAPVHSVADLEALPFAPRWLNVKPSRFGRLEELFAAYAWCARHGVRLYGGGQFELDVGRAQIQALASLFHPGGCNDVAPAAYHLPEAHAELPASPLAPLDWP